jgi:Domain of unknown function (DUF4190)
VTQNDQYVAPQPYQQPGYDYPQPGYQPQKTNTMAILGLVFAFVFSPLGIVFSALGLKQTKERREGGRGLALAGLILSIVFILIGILVAVLMLAVVAPAVEDATQAAQAAAGEDPTGVVAACDVIVPAVVGLDGQLASVTTPEGYAQVLTALGAAMEAAAAQTTDPEFIAHVQTLSGDFQQAVDAVSNGQDPTFLQDALTADGTTIDNDCAAAGWTE